MTLRVSGGGVSVTVQGDAVGEADGILERLAADGVPAALMAGNSSLWGPDVAEEAAGRLGWVHAPERSRRLLPRLAELSARFAGRHVVLAGTGGASLAAQIIARTHGADLTLLDTTDPHQVGRALDFGVSRTVLVVSGPETVETDGVRRVFERAFREASIDPAERVVVVATPGSPLEASALRAGYEVVTADAELDGCFGALSAYALVPAALAGVDVGRLLDEAEALVPALGLAYDNPGLVLGAALGTSAASGRDKLVIADNGSGLNAFGGWVEQLVAESTGKHGSGIVPVVVEDLTAPGFGFGADVRRLVLGDRAEGVGLAVSGPLGAQFLLWEYAAAVACRVIGVSPFDRPAVRESEDSVAGLLRGSEDGEAPIIVGCEPALVDGDVEVHAPEELLAGAKDLQDVFDALAYAVPSHGYLAIMAYLDQGDATARLRTPLARRVADARDAQVTFGWGPRLLHSVGQLHKDGPAGGVFLQITGAADDDLEVPGRPYSLATLQLAQAFGDLRALRSRGLPVLRLHLRDRAAGLARLESALGG
ncbi:glucose-6-phosphate isomerase [Actinoallomurus bryophytorum]|uniref:Glucose-6-phosphate isomerase n=1 Tax=Actinoallomurus bryophytorum TaxID=1490222 RepID=A0A543CW65_9ACTN|nr:glucose-6-phosphate isomerase [Actinoallomurus bryophytorum]TQM01289.1 glucose-6-phosphate isomerase [Actinoallomurus bryophytorum]